MLILPAIDIRQGNCVRLYQGRADQETVYSSDPIAMAELWKSKGAQMLHVVDLDGAFGGKSVNLNLIGKMRAKIAIPIEVGGGFRDMETIQKAFDQGIDRVILGSVAIQNPRLVAEAVNLFGERISVSVDVAGQFAAVNGWKEVSAVTFSELAEGMRELGVSELLFTDTSRDGTLEGPNLMALRAFLKAARVPVIASGGVTTIEDIVNLRELEPEGLKGAIIGKALYDHKILLEEALKAGGRVG